MGDYMKDLTILKQYINSISKYSRITPEEEKELAYRIKNGDQAALDKLINANLKLVVKIAIEICKGNTSIMDVIQNGNLGLIKAAEKFNPTLGVKFSTYSAFWIKQSILRGFIKPALNISISYRKDEINKKIKHYVREFFAKKGKLPDINNIINDLKVKRRDAVDVLLLYKGNGDFQTNSSYLEPYEDMIEAVQDNNFNPESVVEKKNLKNDIITAIESFPTRECEIIKKRYGFSCEKKETLHNLGNKYSISAEATRQIEKKVLSIMKLRFPYLAYYYFA